MKDKYYSRILEQALPATSPDSAFGKPKVLLLFGARQTGKSTMLRHWLEIGRRKTMYVNLQDRRERRRYEADEGLLIRELEAASGIDTVVIDEIQKIPGLLEDIQCFYDQEPRRFQFVLTGSSARQLKRRSANLLPGRVHIQHLSPVLQAEQRPCEILPPDAPPSGELFPMRDLNDLLINGNLPGLYSETPDSWAETLAGYVDLYVENEIRQEHIVEDMGAFLRFLRLAALESGQCVNFTKLARDVGVAANTLRNFYQVLADTYVGLRISAFGRSRKRVLKSPRFLIFDMGVRHLLTGLPFNDTLLKLDPGHLFEQWVLAELYYRCLYRGQGYRLSTWRTATGAEVDAVVETPDDVIPIEIKWSESPSQRDARHLDTFLDLHTGMATRGYIVCRCPRRQKLTERITAVPWAEF